MPVDTWPLAQAVNEIRARMGPWTLAERGEVWLSSGCRTTLGPLANYISDMRVQRYPSGQWLCSVMAYNSAGPRFWPDLELKVRPSPGGSWLAPDPAKSSMEDLLYGRPQARELWVRTRKRAPN